MENIHLNEWLVIIPRTTHYWGVQECTYTNSSTVLVAVELD